MILEFEGQILTFEFDEYSHGTPRRIAVFLKKEGVAFATLSCNMPGVELRENEFIVKVWAENEELAKACAPLFIDTGVKVKTPYCEAPIWRIKQPQMFLVMYFKGLSMSPVAVFDTALDAQRWIFKQGHRKEPYHMMVVEHNP